MTMVQISKENLAKLEALAPLLKKAKLHIEDLNGKVHRVSKFSNLKLGSAELASVVGSEVKETLEQEGVPAEVAEKAADVAAEAVASAEMPAEEGVEEGAEEAVGAEKLDPELVEQLVNLSDELSPDAKGQVMEIASDEDLNVNKMAKLMIPVLKKLAKKKSFSSLGNVTQSNLSKTSVEKAAALNSLKEICK